MAADKFAPGRGLPSDGAQYVAVSPLTIFPETRGPFKVYLFSEGKYVLYTKEMELFTEEHKKRLADYGLSEVYVLTSQKRDYDRYVETHIGDVLGSSVVPVKERAAVFKEYSTQAVKEVLEDRLPSTFRVKSKQFLRIQSLVAKSIGFFKDDNALKYASAILSNEGNLFGHSINVFTLLVCLLNTYGVDDEELINAGIGAMLHDLGKTVLPRGLFLCPESALSGDDLAQMRSHPVKGAALCASLPVAHTTLNVVLLHHEQENGKGYPAGMPGEHIPLPAAACALVNVYDNLTSPLFKGMSPFRALTHMREEMRGHFNVDLYKRFVMILSGADIV